MLTTTPAIRTQRIPRTRFFLWTSVACAIAVLWGFGPTYFLRAFITTRPLSVLVHIHGALFSCWIVFLVLQTTLVARQQTRIHRKIGVWAIALVIAMVPVGVAVDIAFLSQSRRAALFADGPILTMSRVAARNAGNPIIFGVLVSAGLLLRRYPDHHKRLMLLGTIALMNAPMLRIFDELGWPITLTPLGFVAPGNWFNRIVAPALGPPGLNHLVAVPFFLALVVYDLVHLKRVHVATLWGGAVVFLFKPVVVFILKLSGA